MFGNFWSGTSCSDGYRTCNFEWRRWCFYLYTLHGIVGWLVINTYLDYTTVAAVLYILNYLDIFIFFFNAKCFVSVLIFSLIFLSCSIHCNYPWLFNFLISYGREKISMFSFISCLTSYGHFAISFELVGHGERSV